MLIIRKMDVARTPFDESDAWGREELDGAMEVFPGAVVMCGDQKVRLYRLTAGFTDALVLTIDDDGEAEWVSVVHLNETTLPFLADFIHQVMETRAEMAKAA